MGCFTHAGIWDKNNLLSDFIGFNGSQSRVTPHSQSAVRRVKLRWNMMANELPS